MSTSLARKNSRELRLVLPFPPSVNTYWRSVTMGKRRAVLISKAGRQFREAVQKHCLGVAGLGDSARLAVVAEFHMPDRRLRDLDNYQKALFDSLTHAGIWGDDNQLDDIHLLRRGIDPPGAVIIHISVVDFDLAR